MVDRPFIIYGLPRSRTFWLSQFLCVGNYECSHEQMRFLRGTDDAKSWLAQDCVGTVETAAARWWRLVQLWRPDIRTVVVRRPVAEVVDSLLRLDMRGVCTFDRAALTHQITRLDRCLDRIEASVPGVLSVRYDDLRDEQVCANVFEHCLPYDHDHDWWVALAERNLQASMPALMRYCLANRRQIDKAASGVRRQMRALLDRSWMENAGSSLAGVTIQEEPFAAVWRDGQALFAEHAAEVGPRDGVTLDFNVPLVEVLEQRGATLTLTARANGEMVGYIGVIIGPTLESTSLLIATSSAFFVSKRFRGIGPRMQRELVTRLRARGVGEVQLRAGVRGSGPKLEGLYRRMGAEPFGQLFNLSLKAA